MGLKKESFLSRPQRKIPTDAVNKFRRCLKDIDYCVAMVRFFAAHQFKVGIELFAARGASHKHPADVLWKSQHLVTLRALLLSMISHGLVE